MKVLSTPFQPQPIEGFIASIVHFPDVEGFDFPDPFQSSIGFDPENK